MILEKVINRIVMQSEYKDFVDNWTVKSSRQKMDTW